MKNSQMPIKNVVIAGGGSAGWMAAAALSQTFAKQFNITLIESEAIPTVGVGEATIPTLQYFHRVLGLDEAEFMAQTQATFKLGIEFNEWRKPQHSYFHAFGHTGQDCWACGFQHFWLKGREQGIDHPYGDYCSEHVAAQSQRFAHVKPKGLNYAYHLDAGRYAKYLRDYSEKRGVVRKEGMITDVQLCANTQFIQSVRLQSGELINGDLFLDCSGFKGLLIEQALRTGYEDWSHWLPCNSAIALQTASSPTQSLPPFTRSTALDYGWQWQIPLQNRQGNGVVYSSDFVSDDEAHQRFIESLPHEPLNTAKEIRFRTGKRRLQWNKNCIALGLASGFLEPLESTSIHLISSSILRLIDLFPVNGIKPSEVHEFNKAAEIELIGIRDFVILHYKLTERDNSPLWQYCRSMAIPSTLQDKLSLFKETGRVLKERNELFEDSWQQVMLGQGLIPQAYHPIVNNMQPQELQQFLLNIRSQIAQKIEKLPEHGRYLQSYAPAR